MRIGELVQRRIDAGASYRSLSTEAFSAGHPVKYQTFEVLLRDRIRAFPDPGTVPGIAAALHVSAQTALLAIAETLGLEVDTPPSGLATFLPPNTDRLTDRQVAALRALIVSIVDPESGDASIKP